jgi:hypothetical protein
VFPKGTLGTGTQVAKFGEDAGVGVNGFEAVMMSGNALVVVTREEVGSI